MKIDTGSALFIIDQQIGIDNPKLGVRNNPNASATMLKLLTLWRKNNWPIFHIKHCSSTPESVFWPHQEGFEYKPDFLPLGQEVIIEKTTPCAFTKTNLEALLKSNNINAIFVVGASTSNSVESTVRTGGCIGLDITVVEDACFTFAKRDYFGLERTADEVHAMSLANLDGEYAKIKHSSELLGE